MYQVLDKKYSYDYDKINAACKDYNGRILSMYKELDEINNNRVEIFNEIRLKFT